MISRAARERRQWKSEEKGRGESVVRWRERGKETDSPGRYAIRGTEWNVLGASGLLTRASAPASCGARGLCLGLGLAPPACQDMHLDNFLESLKKDRDVQCRRLVVSSQLDIATSSPLLQCDALG